MLEKLNILACAYAARPNAGSEAYVGWVALLALSKQHRVMAIVHGHNRPFIEEALTSLPQRENLQFHYIGERHEWHPNRLLARFQDWRWVHRWSAKAQQLAQKLVAAEKFDLAHHLTIATWRMPSPLGGLGIPLVWGPVGGAESFPFSFYGILSPTARAFEFMRWAGNQVTLRSGRMRRFARSVSVALGNNPETLAALRALGIPSDRVRYLSQSLLGEEKFINLNEGKRIQEQGFGIRDGEKGVGSRDLGGRIQEEGFRSKEERGRILEQGFGIRGERLGMESSESSILNTDSSSNPPLRIFAGGNLEGRKGVAIALQALSLFGQRGHAFTFTYGGFGPELKHLQKLAASLDFGAGKVSLGNHFDGAQYRAELAQAEIYLLPSLREGAPVTMIEAMASGCVPIVANAGGAPMVVDDACGFVVPITNPSKMASDICTILEKLAKDRPLLATLSRAAWQRTRERCMEDAYLRGIEEAYALARKV